jgi:hypothetical protein
MKHLSRAALLLCSLGAAACDGGGGGGGTTEPEQTVTRVYVTPAEQNINAGAPAVAGRGAEGAKQEGGAG